MKTPVLAAFILITLNCIAQHQFDNFDFKQNYLPGHKVESTKIPAVIKTAQRSSQKAIALDFDGADREYANQLSATQTGVRWQLNKNFTNSDNFTLRYAMVKYDSILYVDANNNNTFVSVPLAATQMHLDSADFLFEHHNTTGNTDTIIFSVLLGSSVQGVGTNSNSYYTGAVIWADTIFTNTSIPIDSQLGLTSHTVFPNLQFNAGESFALRVDFSGDTANSFEVYASYRDECGDACAGELSVVPGNSLFYMNLITSNNNLSGIIPPYFDCDGNSRFTPNACENFYIQNFFYVAFVTADIQFGADFANDSLPLCQGSDYLQPNVYGQVEPATYQWSPATGLSSTTDARPYVQGLVSPVVYTVTITDATSATVTASVFVTPDQTECNPVDTLLGSVYFDLNNNGQKDNGEAPLVSAIIASGNNFVQTDSAGNYVIVALENVGTHYVQLTNPLPNSWITQPSGAGFYALPAGINRTDLNFGIHVSPDTNNARISMINYAAPPRPGFASYYQIYCENTLGTNFTGVINLTYDSIQSFIQSTPAPDITNSATHTLSWNVSVPAGSARFIRLKLLTAQTAVLGSSVYQTATVTPDMSFNDVDSFDNNYTLEQTVVGSYDPNDKAVSPAGVGATNSILPGKELTYTIRFQNTGTFYAENVSVADTIDDDMDMSTFKMINASHTYTYTKEGNVIIWRFNKIMLPDSNANEPGSHGFIQYSIRPKSTITHLSVIENTAFIYFDFNPAVVTNTISNLVDFYLGVNNLAKDAIGVQVFPNPFGGQTNFSINSLEQNLTLRITDITGRIVDEIKNVPTPYYTYQNDKLAKGVYNFDLRTNEGIKARGKLVVQ